MDRIALAAAAADELMEVVIPFERGGLVSQAHEQCHIIAKSHEEGGTRLQMQVPRSLVEAFRPYEMGRGEGPQEGEQR